MSSNQTNKVPAYLSYQKQFTPYKWYKPLLATLVGIGFFMVFSVVLMIIGDLIATNQGYDLQKLVFGGYDTLDAYTPLGAVLSLGGVAIMLPAVLLGNKIINARPVSSIPSSRGGFDFAVFFKCFIAGLVIIALPMTIISLLTTQNTGAIRFYEEFGFCAVGETEGVSSRLLIMEKEL